MDASQVRRYLRDFQVEFNHSTGASRNSLTSAGYFYDKWALFIGIVTGVTLSYVHRDNVLDLYSIANTCAIKCKSTLNIR
jgi:hypothetical protein